MPFTRRINNELYSRKAFADAREAYAEYCSVRAAASDELLTITVEVKPTYAHESRQVTLEFWNYFLDSACKQRLEAD